MKVRIVDWIKFALNILGANAYKVIIIYTLEQPSFHNWNEMSSSKIQPKGSVTNLCLPFQWSLNVQGACREGLPAWRLERLTEEQQIQKRINRNLRTLRQHTYQPWLKKIGAVYQYWDWSILILLCTCLDWFKSGWILGYNIFNNQGKPDTYQYKSLQKIGSAEQLKHDVKADV